MSRAIECIRIAERISFEEGYRLQRVRAEAVERGEAGDALFLLEHAPVITLGRKSKERHLLHSREALRAMGVEVCETDRGGDVTYHGPGQLVAYPVLHLQYRTPSINWYLRRLEETVIQLLDTYGLRGERSEGLTGVWVDGAKVAAIGVGIHRWVSYHGVALNVNPDMAHFNLIVPCGIPDKPVTSLAALLDKAPPMDDVMRRFETCFRDRFGESA